MRLRVGLVLPGAVLLVVAAGNSHTMPVDILVLNKVPVSVDTAEDKAMLEGAHSVCIARPWLVVGADVELRAEVTFFVSDRG